MTKPRKTRIQRLECQLRQVRAEVKDLRGMALIRDQLSIDHTVAISQLRKKIDTSVKVNEISIARLQQKLNIANIWSKSLLRRLYRLEQKGFWKQVGRWFARKAGKTV